MSVTYGGPSFKNLKGTRRYLEFVLHSGRDGIHGTVWLIHSNHGDSFNNFEFEVRLGTYRIP